uniref:Actin related protein 1A n=1 Tax=Prolemur simus TaxID=1328070 RepID=A0A8C8ZED8_PROSS
MESYDVIANQPVVIDNVSCVFSISKGTWALFFERIASRVSAWAAGSLSLARPVRRVQPPPPPSPPLLPVVSRYRSLPATVRWRTLGWIKGRAVVRAGPWALRSRGPNRSVRACCPPSPQFPITLLASLAVHLGCRPRLWGSGVIKAGFAGDQIPKYCFPNYVGRPKHVRVMAGALEGDIFIGPKAEEHRGLLSIRYPMEHGIVKDWNDMERIWQYVYSKDQLQTFSEEHPVLLTEAPLNPRKNRERAAEVFFETFNVPALFISMQAVLSLYATGRTTGVVLDSGDGVTHAVPIYEGFAMPHSIMRIDIAGRDVSRFLRLYLRKEGYDFHSSSEFEIVKAIKERACYLSINPQKDETLETEKAQYYLPDGSTIEIGPSRFRAPELLFRPDLIGEESEGIHEVLVFAIQKSDMDLRRTLFSNIVLSGGSTLFKGFGDRLLSEVKKLAPKDVKIRVRAWGSILASLDTFKKMWVSKKEYEEDGARSIHRKTF